MSSTLPRMDMSGLEWTPDVSIYRQPWRESTGACLQAPAGEGITMSMWSSAGGDYGMTSMEAAPIAAILPPGCELNGCRHHYAPGRNLAAEGCACPAWFDGGGWHLIE